MAARLFLFHGADARASGLEVKRWQDLFYKKYGDATRYVVDFDDSAYADSVREFVSALETNSLFEVPKLILLKRVSSRDQGVRSAAGSALAEALKASAAFLDDTVTVAVWEEKRLADKHPLLAYFAGLEKDGKAKVSLFDVPAAQDLASAAAALCAPFNRRLDPQAMAALREGYQRLEKKQRLAKRSKPGEGLAEDERGWWLRQVLETACLLSPAPLITRDILASAMGALEDPVSAFDLADALASGSWHRARQVLGAFASQSEDGDYFALLAALRWRLGRPGGRIDAALALQLLGEAELVMKNYQVPFDALFLLFIERLEAGARGGHPWLLPPRSLWLADLART